MVTAHGEVETPAFMPVGTQGAVKGVTHRDLEALGADILLSNTYHLYLRPGDALIARRGGLHRSSAGTKPILTDSGGYQVFSLARGGRSTRKGRASDSPRRFGAPPHARKATDIQAQLGSDVAMVLDECLAHPASAEAARTSMERTVRWRAGPAIVFLALRDGRVPGVTVSTPGQVQFGIVQGSVFPELREASARRPSR